MPAPLHFFYDVASPYSYLSYARIEDVAKPLGVSVIYRPFLLGGVFRATSNQMPAVVPARAAYLLKDLSRWSKKYAIPFKFSTSFPHNSLLAMRTLTAAAPESRDAIARRVFHAAWVFDRNIADPETLATVLGEDAYLLEKASDQSVKDELRQTTEAAVEAGAFGAPFFLVGSADYWGNDRLEMAAAFAASL
jgi:2-hydroxychromene-2-carboxylate isomerase